MSKPVLDREVVFTQPDNWVVWHNHECNVFKSETEAMQFITKCRYDDPHVSFGGWKTSFSNTNLVTVLEGHEAYDPDIANEYLWRKYMAPTAKIVQPPITEQSHE